MIKWNIQFNFFLVHNQAPIELTEFFQPCLAASRVEPAQLQNLTETNVKAFLGTELIVDDKLTTTCILFTAPWQSIKNKHYPLCLDLFNINDI